MPSSQTQHGQATFPAEHPSAEALLDSLKMILEDKSLVDVLTSIVRLIESHSHGMLCSIFLVEQDGQHMRYAAAPNLPETYRIATDGTAIGPGRGPCSMAAYRRQPIFVADFLSDPDWLHFKDKPVSAGLLAGWSNPIIGHNGQVLGTFGMYFREPRSPSEQEIQLIDYASRVVGIAIERDLTRNFLQKAFDQMQKSEHELRQLIDFLPEHVFVLDAEGAVVQANRTMLDYTGRTAAEMQGVGTDERMKRDLHPEDFERVRRERHAGISRGLRFELETRALGKDGRYRWFLFRYNPMLKEGGRPSRWFATAIEIENRKQAELKMRDENFALREEIDRSAMHEEIVGSSKILRDVLVQVDKVAPTQSTVLIIGETGTGKELIAGAIHKRSKRAGGAFIRVNCAAIPPSLIASELFGHEKGAFTGATQRRLGRFESAHGGTIFLDEVGELPPDTQVALLRVLQERELERVGSSKPISIDVRVLAATNRDLELLVTAGTFRQDLFYRLNVFPIRVPALRERRDDIRLLVGYLVERYSKRAGKKISTISKRTLDLFQSYDWPGNVRELQNVVERAVILSDGDTFVVDESWLAPRGKSEGRRPARTGILAEEKKDFAARERKTIEDALAGCDGRISGPHGAAAKLGIPHQTLESKIASLGIDKRKFKTRSSK
ncbi:MAG TPA: sigma 54-interacting transcriptional regulator [Candidatus Binatia bacterium]|nr:sigma 54-interacting transcriptional regulator [Candidatus Binatia bacterium]